MAIDPQAPDQQPEELIPAELHSIQQKKNRLVVIFGVVLLAVLIGVAYLLMVRSELRSIHLPEIERRVAEVVPTPTETPFPFMELTIPYLRSRKYDSTLGDLELVLENESYSSYLTSYESDGYRVNGMLTIPKGPLPRNSDGAAGFPAVVFVHGYIPPAQYRTLVNYSSYVDFLARRGLVVFKIDLRGHDQSEGEPGGSYYSGDYVIDTLNAVASLKKLRDPSTGLGPIVNTGRIGLWGHSMAGNVVFRSFVAMPEIHKVVIWAGAVYTYEDFSQYRISDASYQPPPADSQSRRKRDELFNLYGQFSTESEFWQQVPATNYLDGVTGSIEVHHAADDPVVSIGYSRNLMSVLDQTGIPHELFEYQIGGHNLTDPSFTQAMQRSADFFRE